MTENLRLPSSPFRPEQDEHKTYGSVPHDLSLGESVKGHFKRGSI